MATDTSAKRYNMFLPEEAMFGAKIPTGVQNPGRIQVNVPSLAPNTDQLRQAASTVTARPASVTSGIGDTSNLPKRIQWTGSDQSKPDGGVYDYLGRTFTSPEDEARIRRRSRARMGIAALGDALRHIGNIVNTTRYAPSQQFNSPVQEEERRYATGKAQRDKDNYLILQRQQEEAKQKAEQAYKDALLRFKVMDYELKDRADKRAAVKAKIDLAYNEARAKKMGVDTEKAQKELEHMDTRFALDDEAKRATIESRKAATARSYNSMNNDNIRTAYYVRGGGRGGGRGGSGAGDEKREYFTAPSGSTFSFPKGNISSENISTLYDALKAYSGGTNYGDKATGEALAQQNPMFSMLGEDGNNIGEKWAAVMRAASTREGFPIFKRMTQGIGYKYEGGLSDEYYKIIYGKPAQKKATAKAPVSAASSGASIGGAIGSVSGQRKAKPSPAEKPKEVPKKATVAPKAQAKPNTAAKSSPAPKAQPKPAAKKRASTKSGGYSKTDKLFQEMRGK